MRNDDTENKTTFISVGAEMLRITERLRDELETSGTYRSVTCSIIFMRCDFRIADSGDMDWQAVVKKERASNYAVASFCRETWQV